MSYICFLRNVHNSTDEVLHLNPRRHSDSISCVKLVYFNGITNYIYKFVFNPAVIPGLKLVQTNSIHFIVKLRGIR